MIPAIDTRVTEEGCRNRFAYGRALVIYDILTRHPHQVTAKVHAMPQDVRDRIVQQIAVEFGNTELKPGDWLYHHSEKLVDEELAKRNFPPENA